VLIFLAPDAVKCIAALFLWAECTAKVEAGDMSVVKGCGAIWVQILLDCSLMVALALLPLTLRRRMWLLRCPHQVLWFSLLRY
jgi:hypothetical protein